METDFEFIEKALYQFECFLLKSTGFEARGQDYSLLLFKPRGSKDNLTSFSIIISAKALDGKMELPLIREFVSYLYEKLPEYMRTQINSVNILNTESPLVKNIKFMPHFNNSPIIKLDNIWIGEETFEEAYLLKSRILPFVKQGLPVEINTKQGSTKGGVVIKIDSAFRLYFYSKDYVLKNIHQFSPVSMLLSTKSKSNIFDDSNLQKGIMNEDIDFVDIENIEEIVEDKYLTISLKTA